MIMRTLIPFACALALGAAGLAAAAPPALFAQSQPGMWELSGLQGAKAPARLCIGDLAQLAQIEHRGRGCKQQAIRSAATSATFTYECSGTDFGRTDIKLVTPRNFQIVSQGIAGGLPFAHTVQARRLGDCQAKAAPSRH
jgi:hypothetical protein